VSLPLRPDFAHQFLLVHAHMSPKRDCGALYKRQL
jgi:hypothetical protein